MPDEEGYGGMVFQRAADVNIWGKIGRDLSHVTAS
jgi:hypothetical protein